MLAYKLVNLTILFVFDKVSLTIMGKGNKMRKVHLGYKM